jgi:uncharacterized membrane protein
MNDRMKQVYIEEVIKHLPQEQRKDIQTELETIIDDKVENEQKTVEEALNELGNPRDFAYQYLDHDVYLIGPRYKDSYINTLKFVAPLVWAIIIILHMITLLFTGEFNFFELLSVLFNSIFIVFTYVTVGFMIAEKVKQDQHVQESWSVNDLDLTKYESKTYKKANIYVSLIFILGFAILINQFPGLIGINVIGTDENIPFLNLAEIKPFIVWLNIGLIIAATRQFVRFFLAKNNPISSIISIALNTITTAILMIVFLNPNFLNPNLTNELAALNFPDFIDFNFIHNIFRAMAGIVAVAYIIDTIKDLRYGFKF